MHKDYEKLFSCFEMPEPPEGLFIKIMARIRQERRLAALKKRLVFFSVSAVGSLVAFIQIFSAVKAEFVQSGLLQFASLIFTDPGAVLSSWNDFLLSILESIPVLEIAAFFAAVFLFLGSLRFAVKNYADVSTLLHPTKNYN